MINQEPLPFIKKYLEIINHGLKTENPSYELTRTQMLWLGFCLMGILLSNSVCWAKFERLSLKSYTQQALSWMFRHSKIQWDSILRSSVKSILAQYGITSGILIIDDKDHSRSKNARKLHRLHKIKDKKTGGYILGQNIILLYLVTAKVSFPISFSFYAPDPSWSEWNREDRRLKKNGVLKLKRPIRPERSEDYPKKYEIALGLLKTFKSQFPSFKVTCVLADALYGHKAFIDAIDNIWKDVQVITQLRKNQKIMQGKKTFSCEQYFFSYSGWEQEITIRGQKTQKVKAGGGRLHVWAQEAKRFVIGLKYEGEKEYRFLQASNLSWSMKSIMEAYTARWLIEVFIEDWSCYNGFCSLAKQCGVEGSERPLILSLLFDHCFLFHQHQQVSIENKLPLASFGSLLEKTRFEALCYFINAIIDSKSPKEKLKSLIDEADYIFKFRNSTKHLSGVTMDIKQLHLAA
jgi:Transposase DDE domain